MKKAECVWVIEKKPQGGSRYVLLPACRLTREEAEKLATNLGDSFLDTRFRVRRYVRE